MRVAGAVAVGCAILVLLAGCLGTPAADPPAPASPSPRPVVVALIDSGINPYHDGFRSRGGPDAALLALDVGADLVQLASSGTWDERTAADASMLGAMRAGRLYAFQGTRALAIGFGGPAAGHPVMDGIGHGTGTAYLAARTSPRSLVVMAKVDASTCVADAAECAIHPSVADAMEWVADQEWIDVVSISIVLGGNRPDAREVHPEMARFLAASARAHESGKLIVNAAGNVVAPPLASYFAGPPWVVAVGGAEPRPRGAALMASQGVDMVANYTELVAHPSSTDRTSWSAGTSFATPIVAGTAAEALSLARAADGTVAPRDLRAALNASALAFHVGDWDPTTPTSDDPVRAAGSPSIPVVAPEQQGWGYVDGSLAAELAFRVLTQDLAWPAEKDPVAAHQERWQQAREALWRG